MEFLRQADIRYGTSDTGHQIPSSGGQQLPSLGEHQQLISFDALHLAFTAAESRGDALFQPSLGLKTGKR